MCPILFSRPLALAESYTAAVIPVSIRPGQIALMRIPVPASWYATVWVIDTTAALDAEYGVEPALDRMPAVDAVAIKLPEAVGLEVDVFRMAGAACLAARKTLKTKC
jgi:hypothetical protein